MTQRDEDIEQIMLPVEGSEEPAYSMTNSARYLGVSGSALAGILRKNPHIIKHNRGFGQEKFLLKKDLDDLLRGRPSTR